ncbi:hypothetical protein GCM10011338_20120 [Alteromonas lipolytica]|uniref:Uncharacterized protein n=1 Tax=Alteromonas lipolytica TaxID=1856405 RepID=A0A1E8FD40_9ALTE|nr:hypothetical protein BFC17_19950 [Alteromonas lipolytica]GGF67917.1 hypothetical protein GCM10011338_20120 [Alteromonas lipolytica]
MLRKFREDGLFELYKTAVVPALSRDLLKRLAYAKQRFDQHGKNPKEIPATCGVNFRKADCI